VATDSDEGENARVTYSLSHGNDEALFHVEELTGVLTTTRALPGAPAEYRLVITAQDHGQPARVTVMDVHVVVNETGASETRRRADDDRYLLVLGVVCGVAVVSAMALVICIVLVVRRSTAKPSHLKPPDTTLEHTEHTTTSDSCVARADHEHWNDEYTRMINVRTTLFHFAIVLSITAANTLRAFGRTENSLLLNGIGPKYD